MSTWMELTNSEYDYVWAYFDEHFNFKPSVKKEGWPSILEPSPSKTWSLNDIDTHEIEKELHFLVDHSFQKISPQDWIYALDWQHACYKVIFNEKSLSSKSNEWTIPVIPEGDYSIFLSSDFKNGIFSHPWEATICVFGDKLLKSTSAFFESRNFALKRQK